MMDRFTGRVADAMSRHGPPPHRDVPDGWQSRLPVEHRGYERVIVDTDVLLVETATGVIRDIIRDVLK